MGTRLNTRRDWDSLWNGSFPAYHRLTLGLVLSVWDRSTSGCSCSCSATATCTRPWSRHSASSREMSHLSHTLYKLLCDFSLNLKHNQTTKSYLVQFPLEVAYSSALPNYTLGTGLSPRSQTLLPVLDADY